MYSLEERLQPAKDQSKRQRLWPARSRSLLYASFVLYIKGYAKVLSTRYMKIWSWVFEKLFKESLIKPNIWTNKSMRMLKFSFADIADIRLTSYTQIPMYWNDQILSELITGYSFLVQLIILPNKFKKLISHCFSGETHKKEMNVNNIS